MSEKMVGVSDMHPMQVQELMDFCCYTLTVAECLSESTGDPEIAAEAASMVESLLEIFGANAIILQTSPGSSGSEPESDLLAQVLQPRRSVGRRGSAREK